MALCISMTKDEADTVAAEGENGYGALVPIVLANGYEWILDAKVIGDPIHAAIVPLLLTFPQREVAAEELVKVGYP